MAINPAHYQTGTVTIAIPEDPTFIGTSSFDKIAVAGATPGVGDAAAFGAKVVIPVDGALGSSPIKLGTTGSFELLKNGASYSGLSDSGSAIVYVQNTTTAGYVNVNATSGTGYVLIRAGGAAGTNDKLKANAYGVTVGSSVPAPIPGQAFRVSTAAQGAASYWDDTFGGQVFPWNTTSSSFPQLAIGVGTPLRLSVQATSSVIYNNANPLSVDQYANADIKYRCQHASGGDHVFTTRGTTEVARFGARGLGIGDGSDANVYALDIVSPNLKQIRAASSATDATTKNLYIQGRHYTNAEEDPIALLMTSSSTATTLSIGGGSGSANAITHGYLLSASTNTSLAGSVKATWNTNGVAVGINPAAPSSGRAFSVSTTAFASSLYVEDSTGHVRMANSNQRILLGPGADLQLYADTSGSPYGTVSALTGTLLLRGQATQGVIVRADNAAGGDIIFQTRGAVERARFNGFAGINLAQGDPTGGSGTPPALQLFWSDTGDNKLIAVDPTGAVFSVDLTAL